MHKRASHLQSFVRADRRRLGESMRAISTLKAAAGATRVISVVANACTLLLAAALGTFLCAPVLAQTIGFAEAIDHLSVSCRQDIAKYCPKANLGGGKIADCLRQNASS